DGTTLGPFGRVRRERPAAWSVPLCGPLAAGPGTLAHGVRRSLAAIESAKSCSFAANPRETCSSRAAASIEKPVDAVVGHGERKGAYSRRQPLEGAAVPDMSDIVLDEWERAHAQIKEGLKTLYVLGMKKGAVMDTILDLWEDNAGGERERQPWSAMASER